MMLGLLLPGRAICKAGMSLLPSVPFHIPLAASRLAQGVTQDMSLAAAAATTSTFPLAKKAVLSIARGGGGGPDAAVDLTRIGMKLSAMQSYALISSLMLGSGLYLFAITPLKTSDVAAPGREGRTQRAAISAFTVLIAACIATSLHTAIIFNVMALYANTALGQALDAEFLKFWNSRVAIALRKNAFLSFVAAIQTFKLSFALSIFLKSDGTHRWVATIAALGIMLASSFAFWQMVGIASLHIFKH